MKESTTFSQGYSFTTEYDMFDFNSGKVLETRTEDSKGNTFIAKVVPAYTIPEYAKMGSKVDNIYNRNMLTQEAASYSYLLDENNMRKVINANITTWNNIWTYRDYMGNESSPPQDGIGQRDLVWRTHKNFIWDGELNADGTYKDFTGTDDNFNWGIGDAQSNAKWQAITTTTRYDHYSMPLETKDINNNYASTKMGDNDSKVLAVANAKYTEMYYSGAEFLAGDGSYFDGGIKSTGWRPDTEAHTGYHSVQIGVGENAFEVVLPADADRINEAKQKFKVLVWVRKGGEDGVRIKINGITDNFEASEKVYAEDWVQLNGYIDIPASQTTVAIVTLAGTVDLDDFRLLPVASSMTSYVYNEWDELWYLIGSNGLASKYEYDSSGRLIKTHTEVEDFGEPGGFKLVKEVNYTNKLTVQMDSNGNGIIDVQEQYTPLHLSLSIGDFNTPSTTVTAFTNGGSGEFEYRWAQGNSPLNLSYGSWGTSNEITISTSCPDGRKYYKCESRDLVTGLTIETVGNHLRECSSGEGENPQ